MEIQNVCQLLSLEESAGANSKTEKCIFLYSLLAIFGLSIPLGEKTVWIKLDILFRVANAE